jgi:pimeloyl-ACP methyl ester carboxylesterase
VSESQLIDTVLGSVRVQVHGSGEAMMFWPSLLMTGDMWAAQASHFGDRCRVILVDPPGHGSSKSSRPHSLSTIAPAASSTSSTASANSGRTSSATRGAG